ncbi:hypothetical protein BDV18DRAFT_146811 [Aspergillus unguis]
MLLNLPEAVKMSFLRSSRPMYGFYGYTRHLPIRPTFKPFRHASLNKSPQTQKNKDNLNQNVDPEIPRMSLQGLGISKNVRIVLYTILGAWGTFETYFYYRAFMRWWKGKNDS